jgi:hypothetical protein
MVSSEINNSHRWTKEEIKVAAKAYREGGPAAAQLALVEAGLGFRTVWAIYHKMRKLLVKSGVGYV